MELAHTPQTYTRDVSGYAIAEATATAVRITIGIADMAVIDVDVTTVYYWHDGRDSTTHEDTVRLHGSPRHGGPGPILALHLGVWIVDAHRFGPEFGPEWAVNYALGREV